MTKIRTNKIIAYFQDLDTGEYRRVIYGNPEELFDFFVDQSEILHRRLVKLGKPTSKKKLLKAIDDSKEGFEMTNAKGAYDDSRILEFEYNIIETT